jgi:hypothetical protein
MSKMYAVFLAYGDPEGNFCSDLKGLSSSLEGCYKIAKQDYASNNGYNSWWRDLVDDGMTEHNNFILVGNREGKSCGGFGGYIIEEMEVQE